MAAERKPGDPSGTADGERPQSYEYARRTGVRRLSWDDIAGLCEALGTQLAERDVEHIVGVATAGLIPATLVSCALRSELTPVRLSRRQDHRVVSATPVWKVPLTTDLSGRCVAIVDDVADTGETLALVSTAAREHGAARVLTACLVAHTWAQPAPDIVALETDDLVVFPWHERALVDGQWAVDPELAEALELLHANRPEGAE